MGQRATRTFDVSSSFVSRLAATQHRQKGTADLVDRRGLGGGAEVRVGGEAGGRLADAGVTRPGWGLPFAFASAQSDKYRQIFT